MRRVFILPGFPAEDFFAHHIEIVMAKTLVWLKIISLSPFIPRLHKYQTVLNRPIRHKAECLMQVPAE